jgi:hypothetical protein
MFILDCFMLSLAEIRSYNSFFTIAFIFTLNQSIICKAFRTKMCIWIVDKKKKLFEL